jgi:sugar phosphate isomerase/epimerase
MLDSFAIAIPIGWNDRAEKIQFALNGGHAIEVAAFATGPAVGNPEARQRMARELRAELEGYPYELSLHGAFIDLPIHSPDPDVARLARQRVTDDLETARQLGCRKAVFHAGYNPLVPLSTYRERFVEAHTQFWRGVSEEFPSLTICLENQWEPEPGILLELMRSVDHSGVRLCLDVAHAFAYSQVPLDLWISELGPFLGHLHWNDNLGDTDSHLAIGEGAIPWKGLLQDLLEATSSSPPTALIELGSLQDVRQSLNYLNSLMLPV